MLKKKTKLIILGSSVVILTSTIFYTVRYKENMNNVQKQKVIASNILFKKISDKKISDAKVLAKKVADKKVADEKIRIAKLNEGITLKEAIAICNRLKQEGETGGGNLYNGTVLTLKSNETQLIKGNLYYVFEIYNEYASDGNEGVPWHLCISKKTGNAYKHYYSNNTLIAYVTEALTKQQTTTKPVEQVKINDGVGIYDKAYAPNELIVRCLPGESYKSPGIIKKGTMIKVYGGVPIGEDQNNVCSSKQYGWSKIKYNNSDAWVKTHELKFANPYNWAPGIKEKFEDKMVGENGYANKKSSIKYKIWKDEPKIDIGPGVYQVYTDISGQHCVVNVNVKTS